MNRTFRVRAAALFVAVLFTMGGLDLMVGIARPMAVSTAPAAAGS